MKWSIAQMFQQRRSGYDPLASEVSLRPEQEEKWRSEFMRVSKGRECIGLREFMECTSCSSRFYAVKLFDALDANGNGTMCFDEYCRFMHLLSTGSSEQLGSFVFNLLDTDHDGMISARELRQALDASIEESQTPLPKTDSDQLFRVLLGLFTESNTEIITRRRFIAVLNTYPDLLGNFTVGDGARAASLENPSTVVYRRGGRLKRTRKWITNNPPRAFAYFMTTIIIVGCLAWRFLRFSGDCDGADLNFRDPDLGVTRQEVKDKVQDVFGVHMSRSDAQYMVFSEAMMETDPMECRDARKRRLLTWTLPIGKACGQGLKPVLLLILFPVSRTVMTKLRRTFLRHIFDFDKAISYHSFLGKVGFWLSWIHSLAQFWHVYRWQDGDNFKQWSFAFPDDKSGASFDLDSVTNETALYRGIPMELLNDPSDQPSALDLICTWVGLTGVVLIVIYTVAALFVFEYPKGLAFFNRAPGENESLMTKQRRFAVRVGKFLNNFNNFWYSHHLFALFYVALVLHPLPDLPYEREEWGINDSWLWVIVPCIVYIIERIARSWHSSDKSPVIGLRLLPGKVVEVKLRKPRKFKYKSGQYIFMNSRKIAQFEWHPFTLTSAPHEPHLSVHIRAAGDWTGALYTLAADYKAFNRSRGDLAINIGRVYPFNVRIAGPYGAPAQNYQDYPVFVCVGAGIGVTPFASILNSVLNTPPREGHEKVEKVYFHWAVRTRKEASWFKTLIDEIAAKDTDGILDINIHITSLKEGNDLRVMLLRLAEFEDTDAEQMEVVSKSVVHFGRPNWAEILRVIQQTHPFLPKIGVFYCGPNALKTSVKQECIKRNKIGGPKFRFRKEIF